MALSEAQKYKILRLMCYPFGTLTPTSTDYNTSIVQIFDNIPAAAQTEIEGVHEKLDKVDTQLDAAISKGGIKRIDDIEFSESKETTMRREKSNLLNDLASLLGFPSRCRSRAMGDVCI